MSSRAIVQRGAESFYYHRPTNSVPTDSLVYLIIFLYLYLMAKKVPQRRNKKAGTSTGKSKSAKYFAANPEARKKKNEYNKKYHSTTARKKYRAKLNKANRDSPNKAGEDKSHTRSGKVVNEKRSTNRARNGKGGTRKKK